MIIHGIIKSAGIPKNIVLAGKKGAEWLENGKTLEAKYEQLFASNKKIKVDGVGPLGYYPNRDSLKYIDLYNLEDVKTFMRATLRHPSFTKGWDVVIKAGLVNETDSIVVDNISYADWVAKTIGGTNDDSLRSFFKSKCGADDKEMKQMDWLGLFDNRRINGTGSMSSSEILQLLLEEKWKMKALDKDMVVMEHQIEYERRGTLINLTSTMVVTGESRQHSAMSKTVGMPIAILAKKILLQEISTRNILGVQIPVMPDVYVPVLKELKKSGIEFTEVVS